MKKSILFICLAAASSVTCLGFSCGNPTGPSTSGTIGITAPVAGQKVAAGDTLLVAWDKSVSSPKISYNYNLGSGWDTFSTVIPINGQSAKVILPVTSYSDSFQVKVEDNRGANNPGTSNYFSIRYIVITNPVAGASVKVGDTVTIRWKDTPDKLTTLRFLLSTDDGKSFGDMLTRADITPFTTSFIWVVGAEPGSGSPFSYPSATCKMKIRDYNNDKLYDVTGAFSVTQ
jgi:hypothetical protein